MIRIGAVNIDTSHPLGFAEALAQEKRATYVAVYNDSFRDDAEVNGFIERFNLETRCESLEELAELCDVAFIHSCNWDDHIRTMRPFIERGIPVFVDKPIVGNLADCREVLKLAAEGAKILGSSSARYAKELVDFLALPVEERGEIVTVHGTSGVDAFNYGIHIVEALGGLIESRAESVRYQGEGRSGACVSEHFLITYASGQTATYTTLTGVWQPFVLTIMTTKTTYHFQIDSSRIYGALMNEITDELEGKGSRLAPVEKLVESIEIMLAGLASKESDGQVVRLADLVEDGPSYDGAAFQASYGASAGPMYSL